MQQTYSCSHKVRCCGRTTFVLEVLNRPPLMMNDIVPFRTYQRVVSASWIQHHDGAQYQI